jgi:ribosomal protein S18 acetylase RimI-like enzyme
MPYSKTADIVELKPEEIGQYNNIWELQGKEDRLRGEMTGGKRKMFVYLEDGNAVGGASLVFENADPDRTLPSKRAYLSYLSVREDFRSRGIGTMLIEYICKYAVEQSIKELTIYVEHSNPRAKDLYLRLGFAELVADKPGKVLLLKRL